jgi:DNA-binding MarR family transcriptional regulator
MPNDTWIQLPADFDDRYPGASASATEAAMNLARAGDLLVRRIAELVQPFGLNPSSALVLAILADSKSPLSPNEIADRLILTRASVTSLLDSLEGRGYVRRMPHPTDRRMLLIELTQVGRLTAREYRLVVHRHQKTWMTDLSEQEKDQLIDMLHRIQSVITDPHA